MGIVGKLGHDASEDEEVAKDRIEWRHRLQFWSVTSSDLDQVTVTMGEIAPNPGRAAGAFCFGRHIP